MYFVSIAISICIIKLSKVDFEFEILLSIKKHYYQTLKTKKEIIKKKFKLKSRPAKPSSNILFYAVAISPSRE